MNAGTNVRAAYMALVGMAGIFLTASTCLGFGGVSVGVGGVGVSVGGGGVGVSAGTGGGGVGVSAGTGGGGTGVSVEGGDGGGGVAVGGGGDEAGVGGASISSGGSGAGDSGASVQTGAAVGISNSRQQQALAGQRASLEMGMNPVRPDRGMKQALSNYYAKTPAASAPPVTDDALNSAVSALPELPSAESPSAMTAPVQSATRAAQSEVESPERATAAESSEDPVGSPAAYSPAASSAKASTDEPATPSRQPTILPPKGAIAGASAGSFARGGTPSTLNRADDPVGQQKMEKTAAKQPAFASRVVHDTAKTTVVIVPPVQAIATSVVADGTAGQPALITHLEQGWDIAGIFPALRTSSLPTAVPILIVMLLSAVGAYGFVRLMSEKCPRCAALLERHSAGCRNCGAQLRPADRSNLRMSV